MSEGLLNRGGLFGRGFDEGLLERIVEQMRELAVEDLEDRGGGEDSDRAAVFGVGPALEQAIALESVGDAGDG